MKKNIGMTIAVLMLLTLLITALVACGTTIQNVDFTITFDVDGATYYEIKTQGSEVLKMPADPTKENYVFDGWYWDKDTWARPFTASSLVNEPLKKDMKVYAKWIELDVTLKTYTVTFNSMGGSAVDPVKVKYGKTFTAPERPTKTGYALVGWFKEANHLTKWDFYTDMVTEDITLYAKWVDESDATGCDILSATGFTSSGYELSIEVPNAQEHFALSTAITVSPYAEWTVTSDIEGHNVVPSATVALIDGNNTYYINVVSGTGSNKKQYTVHIRRREMYTVTYAFNNGEENSVVYAEEDSKIENLETEKTGYTFDKWQYEENAWDFENDTVNGDMILEAVWIANEYTVMFDSNGGSNVDSTTVTFGNAFSFTVPTKTGYSFNGWKTEQGDMLTGADGVSVATWSIADNATIYAEWAVIEYTITYENTKDATNNNVREYTIESEDITLVDLTVAGYTFDGWYENGTKVERITAGSCENKTFTAQWTPITYYATFMADGVQVGKKLAFNIENMQVIAPAVPEKTGYTGVWESYTLGLQDITIDAVYTPITYTISYLNTKGAANSNPTSYNIESDTITLSDITVAGYTFDGWYDDTTKVESIATGSYGNKTFTAQWTPITYYATFMADGVQVGEKLAFNIENMQVIAPAIPEKTGYTGEWESYTLGLQNITIDVVYTPITYTISYLNIKGVANPNPTRYNIESDTIALSDITVAGYTFDGWYDGETKVESIVTGSYGNKIFAAQWTPITYYASFVADGVQVGEELAFNIENMQVTAPAVPEKTGYTGEWDSYALGLHDITINAVYTPISYTISYANTKGALNPNPASYSIENETITFSAITATGYTFDGWFDGETKVESIAKGSIGNMTLVAQWTPIAYTIEYQNTKDSANANVISYTIESEDIVLVDLSAIGYTFDGWFDGETKLETITTGSHGNKVLTAQWTPIVYTIEYQNTKDSANANVTNYTIESDNITLVDLSAIGYTFEGWYDGETKVETITTGSYGNKVLIAQWTPIVYTIEYQDTKDSANANVARYTIESDDITLVDLSAVGYTFDGWYDDETKVESIVTGSYGNKVLTAQWTPVVYTIEYQNTKDSTNTNVTSYTIESDGIVLVDLSAIGYTFDGWYDGETKVESIVTGSYGNKVLTAQWTAIAYTITYLYDNAIGDYAEGTAAITTYTIEDEFELVPLVCKTFGYTFDGWFTQKNVGTGTQVTAVSQGSIGDMTLYAQYGLKEYNIVYHNVNGAINGNPTHYTVETETFDIYPLSKEGYTFDGWFTDEDCTQAANCTIALGSYGDIAMYAKWTPIVYTIEYVTYGGTATSNPATYIVTDDIIFNDAVLSGYVFRGWYTAAEGGYKVTGIPNGSTGNVILYAHWDYFSTITFESNGGSAVDSIKNVEGTAIYAPTAPTKNHYTFAGWYSDVALTKKYTFATQPAEDITLYAKWTPVKYEIEYSLNGGTNSDNNVPTYTVEDKVILYAASKVGYTFIGWFTDAEFTSTVVTELKVGTSGKITLHAHYSINQYTISFESNGGTSVPAITQNYATNVTAPQDPAKNGYTFAGWYSNSSLTSKYTFSTIPAQNITLYAKWNLETYNITYNLNGGKNDSTNLVTYTIEGATITLKAPSKRGYNFAGWFTDVGCTSAITEIVSGSYGDIELFAKWTIIEYTITYVTNGATHNNISTYTIESDLTILTDATLKGHTFGGWYTDNAYATRVINIAGGEIGNKTIYAKFTANTYNVWLDGNEEASCVVSFNLNGAEGTVASQTVTPTATLKYPTTPTREGYIFAGWYNNENCIGSPYDFAAVVTSDTTLFAKWVKVENASALAINSSSTVALNGKEEQMLMFVPLVSGNVTITASGSYDTFGVLYNSEKSILIQDDDNAADGKNFLIVYNVTAGETYYVGIRAFSSTTTGDATVSLSGKNDVLDGGYTITSSKTSATYGQDFTFNVPNARDGYKFLGYADKNDVMYTDSTGASVKVWDKDEETTLFSVWERTIYTVTFETSGGSAIESVKLAYGERFNIGQYVTTRAGYTFNGWYLDGNEYNATTMPDYNITLTAHWKTFALGSIKYDTDKTAVSVNDTITAELFDAICLDTNENLASFTVAISGTQAAGNTISIRLIATSGNKTKQVTISDVKVYGMPSLTVTNSEKNYIKPNEFTADAWGASGTDTYGEATEIKVYINGEYTAGHEYVVVIDSIDKAGNVTRGYVENVKVYDAPTIIYDLQKAAISENDALNASLFAATARDSFGETVNVNVNLHSGTMTAGNTVVIRLTASDSKGNAKSIDITCKVYGMPTISDPTTTEFTESDSISADTLGLTSKDSYNTPLSITIERKEGEQKGGSIMVYTATVTDIAGNTTTVELSVKIYGIPTITIGRTDIKVTEDSTMPLVAFNLNGGQGSIPSQTVNDRKGIAYPQIPTRLGYIFGGWYTDSNCEGEPFDFSSTITHSITLYAKWISYSGKDYIEYNGCLQVDVFSKSSSSVYYYAFVSPVSGTVNIYSTGSLDTYGYLYDSNKNLLSYNDDNGEGTNFKISYSVTAGTLYYIRPCGLNSSGSTTVYISGAMPAQGENVEGNPLHVVAKDSFGSDIALQITLKQGELIAGTHPVYTLTATDKLGNIATTDVTISVYDQADISLTCSTGASNVIKLSSKGEEFFASADDSFGNPCDISVEAAEGFTLSSGNTIDIYVVATDKAGNKAYSNLISDVRVYDIPTIVFNQQNYTITADTDINFLFSVYDSFGEELVATITPQGDLIADTLVDVIVQATDDAGNTVERIYRLFVIPSPRNYVELYVAGKLWKTLFVSAGETCVLPMPEVQEGYRGVWLNADGQKYAKIVGVASTETKLNFVTYKQDYTPITTSEELKSIALDGKYLLLHNLDLAGMEWTPIGTSVNPFIGTFEGNNYTISNFKVTSSVRAGGLFGYNQGIIKNLSTKDFTINTFGFNAGGIVGHNSGSITNCYALGNITITSSDAYSRIYAGGIVGYNSGSITNCYATGNVTASNSASNYKSYAGGIAGDNSGSIINCYATGNVTASSSAAGSDAGGIAGDNSGSITNCYATGNVSAYGSSSSSTSNYNSSCNAGGIVGYNEKNIANCYATGNATVSNSNSKLCYTGGIIGINQGGSIIECYRYDGQQFMVTKNSTTTYAATNTIGTLKSLAELHSLSFHTTTLGWSSDIWNFAGSYPTLNYAYINRSVYISSVEELMQLNNQILFAKYILTSNLDLGGMEWTPIGTKDNPFVGTFDGNGHSISNFIVNGSVQYAGLFGYNQGTIENLTVEKYTIKTSYSNNASYAGGIAGYNSGSIANCYANGIVSASSSFSAIKAGGIAGYSSGSITDCYSTGNVTASGKYCEAGGIAGYNSGSITDCYSTGKVTVIASSPDSGSDAGGIVGYNDGSINNCRSTGDVTASSTGSGSNIISSCCAGGIAGYNRRSISNCYSTGDVFASSNSIHVDSCAGGIAGYNWSGGRITNSYTMGNVTASGYGYIYAGGIAGINKSNITNCYATGNATVSSFSSGSSSSYSRCYAGGIVGLNENGSVTDCYRYGEQQFMVTKNGTTTYVATNTDGTAKSLTELQSVSFHITTLGWNSDIWNFADGTYPTLKNVDTTY